MECIYVPVQVIPNLTSFAAKLKRLTDKRDNRGKRHALAFVLGGVVLAIIVLFGVFKTQKYRLHRGKGISIYVNSTPDFSGLSASSGGKSHPKNF